MTTISYNGQNLPQPLPLISKEEGIVFIGERWAVRETYRLQGSLIGCDGLQGLLNSGTSLLNIFNRNFQEFIVQEDGSDIIRTSGTIVESITFGDSNYAGEVPYTITVSCYPAAIQNTFGVLDPVDQWSFGEGRDGIITVNHNLSARAYGNYQNAVTFVQNRTGTSNVPSLQFLSLTGSYVLTNQEETIDRLNGIYSVNETYQMDKFGNTVLTRYNFTIESGLEGFIQANLNGNIEGGLNSTITDVRTAYNNKNFRQITQTLYNKASDLTDLNVTPLASGVIEDTFNKRLSFNFQWDNNPDPVVSLDRSINITETDEITQVTVNGRVFGRGEQNFRWNQIQSYFNNVNIYGLAQSGYTYHGGSFTLNPKPTTSGTTINQFNSEITFSVEFNDRAIPPAGFVFFDHRVNITPSIRKIVPRQISAYEHSEDSFCVVDLGFYSKVRMTIQGTAVLDENVPLEAGKQLLIDEVERLFYHYGAQNPILEAKDISSNPDFGRQLTFNFSWIMDSTHRVNSESSPSIVGDLVI